MYFHWRPSDHDLQLMASRDHYDRCDFTGATTLAPVAPSTSEASYSYYLPCTTAGEDFFLSCSVGTHCASGQKLHVQVSTTASVYSSADPPELLLHSDSLRRVMTLLGHTVDPATGYAHLERGYSTEAAANVSLEMVWCLEAHCPSSALDWDPAATRESCLAEVYNLGGFLSRKRPEPSYEHAESYYKTALAHDPSHCPALGYLAELRILQGNRSAAKAAARDVCRLCGGAASSSAGQLRLAFQTANISGWWPDEAGACGRPSPPPPQPPPQPPPLVQPRPPMPPGSQLRHSVRMELIVGGSIASFDSIDLRMRIASALGIPSSRVRIEAEAASVRVRVLIDSTSGAEAQEVAGTLATFSSNTTALTAALDVNVLSIVQMPIAEAAVVASSTMGGAASTPASLLFAPALPPMPSQAIRVGGGLPSGALLIIVASLGGLAALISLLAFVFSPRCRSWFQCHSRSAPPRRGDACKASARSASHASAVTADETLQNRPSSSSSSFSSPSSSSISSSCSSFSTSCAPRLGLAGAPADPRRRPLDFMPPSVKHYMDENDAGHSSKGRGLRRDSNLASGNSLCDVATGSKANARCGIKLDSTNASRSRATYTPEYAHTCYSPAEKLRSDLEPVTPRSTNRRSGRSAGSSVADHVRGSGATSGSTTRLERSRIGSSTSVRQGAREHNRAGNYGGHYQVSHSQEYHRRHQRFDEMEHKRQPERERARPDRRSHHNHSNGRGRHGVVPTDAHHHDYDQEPKAYSKDRPRRSRCEMYM